MSTSTCSKSNVNVKHVATLFEEVQNRYVKKLTAIDEKQFTGEERHKQKLAVYESYVKDLSIQTRLLLQSLDELEKEANQRVCLLENKLKKANASLQQHHSLSDVTKTVSSIESEKWKLNHENLDLKHDIDCLTTFINTAKRTGKWDTKRLQLKTVPIDRITGVSTDENAITVPFHKEIQYRDERIQVLQAEIDQLRKTQTELAKQTSNKPSLLVDDDLKGQNNVLSNKVDDLRLKLVEECQKSETLKMDIRVKMNEIKDIEEEFKQSKQRYEQHISDLSNKLKTITDRHRESTNSLNNDIKLKKQQIEQYVQQIEQLNNEKVQLENEKSDLQRQCRVKDSITADFETQIRNLQREVSTTSYPIVPIEPTIAKIEYDKLDQELQLTRKKLDNQTNDIKSKESLISKLEQDIRLLRKSHDDQLEQQTQMNTNDCDLLRTEIRTLKRVCEERENDIHKQSLDLRKIQDLLSIESMKTQSIDQENHQLKTNIQIYKDQIDKLQENLRQLNHQNEQYEYAINDFNSQNQLIESKLIEAMTVIDLRNKTLIDYEEQMNKYKFELTQKQKDLLDKQIHIEQLEQTVIEKTAEVAHLNETLETGLVQSHHREKYAEENASKALHDIKVLQRDLRHLSEKLTEEEQTNQALNEKIQHLTNQYQLKQDEFHKMQKSLNKQLTNKQEQLVRLDENLHEFEIQSKYTKEECLIQEKEITRLNEVQEEQGNKIKTLQENILNIQQEKETIQHQFERCDAELRNIKITREDEIRRHSSEIDKFREDISALRSNEQDLLKNLDEIKDKLAELTSERDEIREQNEQYQNEIENIQKMLYDETESASKSAAKIVILTRQLDDEQKRSTDATRQLDDIKMQLKGSTMTNETLKTELNQARCLIQEYIVKETDLKQSLNRTNCLYEEQTKSLDDRLHEIEALNQLLARLQIDYEKSKNDLSNSRDQIVQYEISTQTLKQHLNEKTNDLSSITTRLQQIQQDLHNYEKAHRYSNDEYFEREQRLKLLENELSTMVNSYEKLQHDHSISNEQLQKYRTDLEQTQKSDQIHQEQLQQSTDEAQICKRKLSLLGNCFKTIVRKASETSERWANVTARLHEQITDLSEDFNKLRSFDERLEQSTRMFNLLRSQHEDLILQYVTIKPVLEKTHLYVREYKRKWSQTSDENRQLKMEIKRLRNKLEDFHRAEGLMHSKIEEQTTSLTQLRKELSNEGQTRSEAQVLIERLKRTLDETVHVRDQLTKDLTHANKKLEKNENDIEGYVNENRLLHQATQKLEKQLAHLQSQNESLQQIFQQNEYSYQTKINEYESLLISLKDANQESIGLFEQKKAELNLAQTQIQTLKYEQSIVLGKTDKIEEMNRELKQHVTILERANEEYKRMNRKREKELDQIKTEYDHQLKANANFENKCIKQETDLNALRHENASLNEELKLMKENVVRSQDEQKRLRQDCDQALNLIHDGIPELCSDDGDGSLQEHLKKIPCLMQQLTGDRENLKTKNALLLQFVRGLSHDLNDCQSSQKKYKLLKAHSKQQQLLLNQLETHVNFYETAFREKGFFPAIEYTPGASAPDVIDSNHHHHHHHRKK